MLTLLTSAQRKRPKPWTMTVTHSSDQHSKGRFSSLIQALYINRDWLA